MMGSPGVRPQKGTTAVVLADAFARSRCYDGGVMGMPMEGVISTVYGGCIYSKKMWMGIIDQLL